MTNKKKIAPLTIYELSHNLEQFRKSCTFIYNLEFINNCTKEEQMQLAIIKQQLICVEHGLYPVITKLLTQELEELEKEIKK